MFGSVIMVYVGIIKSRKSALTFCVVSEHCTTNDCYFKFVQFVFVVCFNNVHDLR